MSPSTAEDILANDPTKNHCPQCDSTNMREEVRPQSMTYKGQTRTVPTAGLYCLDCGEGIHTLLELIVSDAALQEMIAAESGVPG